MKTSAVFGHLSLRPDVGFNYPHRKNSDIIPYLRWHADIDFNHPSRKRINVYICIRVPTSNAHSGRVSWYTFASRQLPQLLMRGECNAGHRRSNLSQATVTSRHGESMKRDGLLHWYLQAIRPEIHQMREVRTKSGGGNGLSRAQE